MVHTKFWATCFVLCKLQHPFCILLSLDHSSGYAIGLQKHVWFFKLPSCLVLVYPNKWEDICIFSSLQRLPSQSTTLRKAKKQSCLVAGPLLVGLFIMRVYYSIINQESCYVFWNYTLGKAKNEPLPSSPALQGTISCLVYAKGRQPAMMKLQIPPYLCKSCSGLSEYQNALQFHHCWSAKAAYAWSRARHNLLFFFTDWFMQLY